MLYGTSGAALVQLCATPAITRLYSPGELGQLALLLSFTQLWISGQLLRFDQAQYLARSKKESLYTAIISLWILAVTLTLNVVCITLLVSFHVFGFGELPINVALFSPIICAGFGIFVIFRAINVKEQYFSLVGQATLVKSIVNNGIKLAGGWLMPSVTPLFVGEALGAWASSARLSRVFRRLYNRVEFTYSRIRYVAILRRNSVFPLVETPSIFIDKAASMFPIPATVSLFGTDEAGILSLAILATSLPTAQISSAIADVFLSEFSTHVRAREFLAARKLFFNTLTKLVMIGIPLAVIYIVLGPMLAGPILGDNFARAGHYVAIIALWHCLAFIISPISRILPVFRQAKLKLIYDVSKLASLLIVYILAERFAFSASQFVLYMTYAYSANYLLYSLIIAWTLLRRTKATTAML